MIYEPKDVKRGLRCAAPVKRNRTREYEAVEVTWSSSDGFVVEVETTSPRRRKLRTHFALCDLRRPGTPTPSIGYVVL